MWLTTISLIVDQYFFYFFFISETTEQVPPIASPKGSNKKAGVNVVRGKLVLLHFIFYNILKPIRVWKFCMFFISNFKHEHI